MVKAMDAVHSEGMSGPIPYLSKVEEVELTSFLIQSSGIGYGKTKREVSNKVKQAIVKKGRKVN